MIIKFEKEKETKGSIRYKEIIPEDEKRGPIVQTIYVQKWFAKGRDNIEIEIKE